MVDRWSDMCESCGGLLVKGTAVSSTTSECGRISASWMYGRTDRDFSRLRAIVVIVH